MAIFAHISQKSGKEKYQVHITVTGDIVSDKESAVILINEFANNYSLVPFLSLALGYQTQQLK